MLVRELCGFSMPRCIFTVLQNSDGPPSLCQLGCSTKANIPILRGSITHSPNTNHYRYPSPPETIHCFGRTTRGEGSIQAPGICIPGTATRSGEEDRDLFWKQQHAIQADVHTERSGGFQGSVLCCWGQGAWQREAVNSS